MLDQFGFRCVGDALVPLGLPNLTSNNRRNQAFSKPSLAPYAREQVVTLPREMTFGDGHRFGQAAALKERPTQRLSYKVR